jgi:predicted transcriptional regulator
VKSRTVNVRISEDLSEKLDQVAEAIERPRS